MGIRCVMMYLLFMRNFFSFPLSSSLFTLESKSNNIRKRCVRIGLGSYIVVFMQLYCVVVVVVVCQVTSVWMMARGGAFALCFSAAAGVSPPAPKYSADLACASYSAHLLCSYLLLNCNHLSLLRHITRKAYICQALPREIVER